MCLVPVPCNPLGHHHKKKVYFFTSFFWTDFINSREINDLIDSRHDLNQIINLWGIYGLIDPRQDSRGYFWPSGSVIMLNTKSNHKFPRNLWFDWSVPKCNQTIIGTWNQPFLELASEQETSSWAGSLANGFEEAYINIWYKISSYVWKCYAKNEIYSFGPHIHRIGISRPAICMKSRSESNGIGPEA